MDQKALALQLGLPETADEAAINAELAKLKKAGEENAQLAKDKERLELEALTAAVDTAISEKRIGADRKSQFIELGKKIGLEELKKTFEAMSPQVKLSQTINATAGAPVPQGKVYAKLSEVPGDELLKMRAENPGEYKRLYKAEYGIDCEI